MIKYPLQSVYPSKVCFFDYFSLDSCLCSALGHFPADFPQLLFCNPFHTHLQEEKEEKEKLAEILIGLIPSASKPKGKLSTIEIQNLY